MTDTIKSRLAQTVKSPTSPSDWAKHRKTIERLYVQEEKSLSTVIEELKRAHGFFATERQYKRRISRWRLDKNVKDDEMRAIIATEATRLRQGKQSTFYVRDRQVDPLKIKRFARRKRIERTMCVGDTLGTLPALVRCITPPPSASLSSTSGIALPSVAITQHSRTKPMTRIRSLDGDKSSFAALSADRCHANDTDTSDLSPTQTQPSICEAKSSQAPTSAGATYTDSLDRVLSDIYQDELYNPSVTSSSPPQPPRQYITKERSSSTQRNSAVHDLLQAAQSGHVAARQPSPTHLPQEQSCFRPGSQEQISISKDPIFGLILGPSGAQKDNVEASDLSEARHRTFLLKNDYSLIDQGLPDKDRPMLIAEEYLDSILPQLQEYKASRWANVEPPQGFDKARYYKNPIVVNLFSLPPSLRERPIDAFYFHFFIDYTAIVLLPYPCSEILPKMALRNKSLLALLLTYSACHRARLLGYPQPTHRIALWTQDVFPSFRRALSGYGPAASQSKDEFAIAIMLASFHILSPNALGVSVKLQDHLHLASSIYEHLGAALNENGSTQADEIREFSLLSHWFFEIYLMDALSKPYRSRPSKPILECSERYQGYCNPQFVNALSSTAELVGDFEEHEEMSQSSGMEKTSAEVPYYHPSRSAKLINMHCSRPYPVIYKATEQLKGWAVAILLYRRVEGRSNYWPNVQYLVRRIFGVLETVRPGDRPMQHSILFPLFIAGCEALTAGERQLASIRFEDLEKLGQVHVTAARQLMEKVWQTHEPWWKLSKGEYLGQL